MSGCSSKLMGGMRGMPGNDGFEMQFRKVDVKEEDSLTEDALKDYLSYHIKDLVDVNEHEIYEFRYDKIYDKEGVFDRWTENPIRTEREAKEEAKRHKAEQKVNKWVDAKLAKISDRSKREEEIKQIKKDYDGGFIASLARGSRFLEKNLPVTKSILSAYRKGKKGKQSKKRKGSKKKAKKHVGGGKSRKPKKAMQTRKRPKKSRSRRPRRMRTRGQKRAGAADKDNMYPYDQYDT
jgi:hypothetical protein